MSELEERLTVMVGGKATQTYGSISQKGLQSSDSKSSLRKGHEDNESSNSSSDRNHSSSSGDNGIDREIKQKESKESKKKKKESKKEELTKKKRLKHTCISVGCWNVQSLVSNTDRSSSIPRKSELVVQELRRLGIVLAGLSETRWLGSGHSRC